MNGVVPAAALLLSGCACLVLFVRRDSSAEARSRLLPAHATDLGHPVGSGIAMTFLLCLCMMSFLVYGPILLIRLYGLTALEAGLVVVSESLGWTAGAFFPAGPPRPEADDPERQRPVAGGPAAGLVQLARRLIVVAACFARPASA